MHDGGGQLKGRQKGHLKGRIKGRLKGRLKGRVKGGFRGPLGGTLRGALRDDHLVLLSPWNLRWAHDFGKDRKEVFQGEGGNHEKTCLGRQQFLVDVSNIFYFFCSKEEKGESEALEGGRGSIFLLKIQGGRGVSQDNEGWGARGQDGDCGEFRGGGGGQIFFFRAEMPTKNLNLLRARSLHGSDIVDFNAIGPCLLFPKPHLVGLLWSSKMITY